MQQTTSLVQLEVDKELSRLKQMLEEEGCATHFLNIVEKFKKDYTQKKIFNGLQNQYQQIKYSSRQKY